MADDKRIDELAQATELGDDDLFVLQQQGEAKSLSASVLKEMLGGGSGDDESVTSAAASAAAAKASAEEAAASASAAETAQSGAENAKSSAQAAYQATQQNVSTVQEYARQASNSESAATSAASSANSSKNAAATSASNAATSASNAASSATSASSSASSAETAKTAAETAQAAAETAQGKAESAQTAAETAKSGAESAKTAAASSATAASNSASAAETSATNAKTSETNAANSAAAASSSASSASASASAAQECLNEVETKLANGEFDGADGYTPVKGTDYWTDDDKAEMVSELAEQAAPVSYNAQTLTEAQQAQARENIGAISEADLVTELAKRGQLAPEYANSIEECTDTSKMYVLPDGYIYAYMKHTEEVVIPGETVTTPGEVTFLADTRYSLSSSAFKASEGYDMLIIPVVSEGTSDAMIISLTNMTYSSHWTGYLGATNNAFTSEYTNAGATGVAELTVTSVPAGEWYLTLCVIATDTSNLGVTVDGEVFNVVIGTTSTIGAKHPTTTTTEGSTEIIETEGFVSTGLAFVPADYEDRIIDLEEAVEGIAENSEAIFKNTERIEVLEEQVGTVDENAVVHNAIGTTYPPSQKPAETAIDGYDIDILNALADDVHTYIDAVVSDKETVTKEIMGKDASGVYDIARYIYANREHIAWQKQNYPKMYAWQNGSTVIYSVSVSPRIGDTMYSTAYIGTAYSTVTAVSATNRSRTVNGLEFVRYESGDIEPTVIYTDADDDRNSNTSITQGGITYNRYPLGDLGANRTKLIPIFIYANEHGIYPAALDESNDSYQKYETKMCALIAARMLRDFAADKQMKNPLYKYIRENCMLIVIPVVNPYGFNLNVTNPDTAKNGYTNSNGCNINRNYDCPGWDVMLANGESAAWMGEYPGSENETQYVMDTMVESGAVVAMSLHGLGGWAGYCAHQGQSPDGSDYDRDKLEKVNAFLVDNYGYTLRYYDIETDGTPKVAVNTPDITSKSPSFITQCGAYGGIVEFQPDDVNTSGFLQEMKSNVIENAYAQTLNLTAMWLSDYLEA